MLMEAFLAALVEPPEPSPTAVLSEDELMRLQFWKWLYTLEGEGFTSDEAKHIILLKHLHVAGQL